MTSLRLSPDVNIDENVVGANAKCDDDGDDVEKGEEGDAENGRVEKVGDAERGDEGDDGERRDEKR